VVICSLASTARAQWTATSLQPDVATHSYAYGVNGGQQAGQVFVNGTYHASLWNGSAASWVDIHPVGASESVAKCAGDGQQGGWVGSRASLWYGTAASRVDLHPAGTGSSAIYGVGGGQQVGNAVLGGLPRASLWSGTAVSWVNLHPAGAIYSEARGVGDGQQVGYANFGNGDRASLWSGTAASWVDLNPAGAVRSSASDVDSGKQVGTAEVLSDGVYESHASLWSGTAASWVDLNPPGSTLSHAVAVSGGQQVGIVGINGVGRASLWSGSSASWVDLSAFLPDGYTEAGAMGIFSDANFTYVAGYAVRDATGKVEAMLWSKPVPEPCAAALFSLCALLSATRRRRTHSSSAAHTSRVSIRLR
jgi:hypothetical protein